MAVNLIYKNKWPINDKISVVIPTVGQIVENEEAYYTLVSLFTSSPYDMMLVLDDAGYDFRDFDDYTLFITLFGSIRELDTSLILGDINLKNFELKVNDKNGQIILVDSLNDIVIDRSIYEKIAMRLRVIHGLKKNNKKVQDDYTKNYLLERARKKRGKKNNGDRSHLETLIVAMVNTEQFKYNYETVKNVINPVIRFEQWFI